MPEGSCNLLSGDLLRNGTNLFLVHHWRLHFGDVLLGLQFHASLEVNLGVHATEGHESTVVFQRSPVPKVRVLPVAPDLSGSGTAGLAGF